MIIVQASQPSYSMRITTTASTHPVWKFRTLCCRSRVQPLQGNPHANRRDSLQFFPVVSLLLHLQVQVANLVYSRRPALLWKRRRFHPLNRPIVLQGSQPGSHRGSQQDSPLPSLPGSPVTNHLLNRQGSQLFSRVLPLRNNLVLGRLRSHLCSRRFNQQFNQAHSHQLNRVEFLLLSLLINLRCNHPDNLQVNLRPNLPLGHRVNLAASRQDSPLLNPAISRPGNPQGSLHGSLLQSPLLNHPNSLLASHRINPRHNPQQNQINQLHRRQTSLKQTPIETVL